MTERLYWTEQIPTKTLVNSVLQAELWDPKKWSQLLFGLTIQYADFYLIKKIKEKTINFEKYC